MSTYNIGFFSSRNKKKYILNTHLLSVAIDIVYLFRQMRVRPAELSNKTSFWQDGNRKKQELDEEEDACTQMQVSIQIKIKLHL